MLADLAPLNAPLFEKLAQLQDNAQLLKNVQDNRSWIHTYMHPFVKSELHAQENLYALQEQLKKAAASFESDELKRRIANYQEYRITRKWLLRSLKMTAKKTIPPQTLHNWTERGIIHNRAFGHPDPQSAARLLVYILSFLSATEISSVKDVKRGWLPSEIDPKEPMYWIWMQTDPTSEPCQIPLPTDEEGYDNLPASNLLWSGFAGAGWLPGWLPVGGFGAVRWAGRKRNLWKVTKEDVARWRPTLRSATI